MDDALDWGGIQRTLPIGSRVSCIVVRHAPFGVFTSIPAIPYEGLIQIPDFKDQGRMTVDEYPPIGTIVTAVVLGFKQSGHQIWLGVKPSQLERSR